MGDKYKNLGFKMKNKIYFTEENKQKIEDLCSEVNGKARVHIASYELVKEAVKEAKCFYQQILKKHGYKLWFKYSNNEEKAKSYKYKYQATTVIIGFDKTGFYINEIKREDFYPNQTKVYGLCWKNEEDENTNKQEVKDYLYKSVFLT